MQCVIVTDPADLQALAPEWRALLADSESDEPTMSPDWLLTWWSVYGQLDSRELRVIVLRHNGALVGLAPLVFRRHWYRPGLPFRRLESMGSGERSGDGIVSDYLGVVARRGHEDAVATALVSALSAGSLGRWDEMVVPLMDGDKSMPFRLADAAGRAGLSANVEETTRAPYIPLPQTWDGYLSALGKKGRYLIKRSLRDFEAWADGEWCVVEATSSTLSDLKRILEALHEERWDDNGGGVFRSRHFSAFHDQVMPLLLERDALELLCLQVRGEPVAAMYNVRWANKTYFYQCGRSRDVPSQIRPGGVLLYLAVRRAIEAGQREFDFLGGEALYKKQLALASRPLVNLRIARRSIREHGRLSVRSARKALV
jgi:CelD/BcsL family acetyltransferase involved in cellulose biosynthesis